MTEALLHRDTVLVVEDQPESLRLLTDTLETSGITVLVATSGQGALDLMAHVVPDLVLFEVLRGFRDERPQRQARTLMMSLDVVPTSSVHLCLQAAQHYRDLRRNGVTVRSSIDVLVATFCIEHDYVLLHRDRDFQAFEDLRGLRGWKQ